MSKNYVIFNKKHSHEDLELLLETPILSSSNEDVEEVEVEGRHGTLTIKKGTYKNKEIPLSFSLLRGGNEDIVDFYERVQIVKDWLEDIEDNDLIVYLKPNRKYTVKRIKKNDIPIENHRFAKFETNFICEPFMYELDERTIEIENNSTIYYKGTVEGECNIKIYGNGNIQLTINDETVQINNVNQYVELDSKLSLCLNKDKTSKSRDMIGHFPLLTRGLNNISWSGNVSKVEILPRTAYE